MLGFLPAPLLGVLMAVLLVINTLFWAIPVYLCILGKILTPPRSGLRQKFTNGAAAFAKIWAHVDIAIADALLPTRWRITNTAQLSRTGQYLVCCNHQSWNDILAVIKAMGHESPFFKFFLKQELIWVPVLGPVWWGLDYPFMKRGAAKRTTTAGGRSTNSDLEATRRACERFREQPAVVLNFLEGTRFTPAKHASQKSPFQHLLKPKSGGFAFALEILGDHLHSVFDVTIVYPKGGGGLWTFLSGRIPEIVVDVRTIDIPPQFVNRSYESDPAFRKEFQQWINLLWTEKDQRIAAMLAG